MTSLDEQRELVQRLADRCRDERQRTLGNHWTHDYLRHCRLYRQFKTAKAVLAEMEKAH